VIKLRSIANAIGTVSFASQMNSFASVRTAITTVGTVGKSVTCNVIIFRG
jgi:hypothetical protein